MWEGFRKGQAWGAGLAAGGLTAALLFASAAVGGSLDAFSASANDWAFTGLMGLAAAIEAGLSVTSANDCAEGEVVDAVWPRRLAAATGILLLLMAALPLTLQANAPAERRPLGALWLGCGLMAVGAGLRAGAIVQLGRRFNSTNAIEADARLEDRGLYRMFAHPSEVGLLSLVFGGLVLVGQPIVWLFFAPFYGLVVARLRLEEGALCARHGDAYRRYRARTFDPMPAVIARRDGR